MMWKSITSPLTVSSSWKYLVSLNIALCVLFRITQINTPQVLKFYSSAHINDNSSLQATLGEIITECCLLHSCIIKYTTIQFCHIVPFFIPMFFFSSCSTLYLPKIKQFKINWPGRHLLIWVVNIQLSWCDVCKQLVPNFPV